jgi:hypothetical protein
MIRSRRRSAALAAARGLLGLLLSLGAAQGQEPPGTDRTAYLLLYGGVQEELRLDASQQARIRQVFERPPLGAAPSPPVDDASLARRAAEALTPSQAARLSQIRAQAFLARGDLPIEILKALELDPTRSDRLRGVLAENQAAFREYANQLEAGQFRTPESRQALRDRLLKPGRERLESLLTEPQKAELKQRLGPPFPPVQEMVQDLFPRPVGGEAPTAAPRGRQR